MVTWIWVTVRPVAVTLIRTWVAGFLLRQTLFLMITSYSKLWIKDQKPQKKCWLKTIAIKYFIIKQAIILWNLFNVRFIPDKELFSSDDQVRMSIIVNKFWIFLTVIPHVWFYGGNIIFDQVLFQIWIISNGYKLIDQYQLLKIIGIGQYLSQVWTGCSIS